jgi:hypothetical protein
MKKKFHEFIKTQVTANNMADVSFLLYGILAEVIFERGYFSKNSDIKTFTSDILQEDYKEYLFASRTSLYARIVKDMKLNIINDTDKFLQKANNVKVFLKEHGEEAIRTNPTNEGSHTSKSKKKNTSKNDAIDEWRKIINPNKG